MLLEELRTGALGRKGYEPRRPIFALEDLRREPAHPQIAMAIAPWVLSSDHELAQAAAETVDQVLRALRPEDALWFEQHRHARSPFDPRREAWDALRPLDLARFDALGGASASVLCVASMHANGHTRQACVERLSLVRASVELPFLIVRANDWVRPVRAAAKIAVLARIVEASRGDVARGLELLVCLPLFERLAKLGRDDHRGLRDAFEKLLVSPELSAAVEAGTKSKSRAVRHRCLRIAIEDVRKDKRELLARALVDRDVSIQRWAAQTIVSRLASDELRAMAEQMSKNTNASVRNEGVFVLAAKVEPPDFQTLERALLDPSPSVRWTARHYLTEARVLDVRDFYVRALSDADPSRLAAAAAGLGECGQGAEDAERVAPLCTHPSPLVRRAALGALDELDGNRHVEVLLAALHDERASVAREAATRLKKHVRALGEPRIAALLRDAERAHTRRLAVRLVMQMDRRAAIPLLLEAALDQDESVALEVQKSLRSFLGWARVHKLRLDPMERERLTAQLTAARTKLDERIATELSAIFRA